VTHIPFLPTAEAEFLQAVAGYEDARAGLGAEFVGEVERATRRIALFPQHGSPYLGGTRRIVLRRFPFSIVYLDEPETPLIVAVAHHRQKPGYWKAGVRR
jgi:plasmid stabilization system protein ParE